MPSVSVYGLLQQMSLVYYRACRRHVSVLLNFENDFKLRRNSVLKWIELAVTMVFVILLLIFPSPLLFEPKVSH